MNSVISLCCEYIIVSLQNLNVQPCLSPDTIQHPAIISSDVGLRLTHYHILRYKVVSQGGSSLVCNLN